MNAKGNTVIVLGALLCAYGSLVSGQNETTTVPPTTFSPPTPPPSTPSTSTPSTTTTKAPDTTTAPPSTTTVAPAPTSSPKPKPFPANEGKWSVENANNVSCIVMKGAVEIALSYVDEANVTRIGNVDVPAKATESGKCGDGDIQTITLSWNVTSDGSTMRTNQLTFVFEANMSKGVLEASEITSGKFALSNVTGVIYKDIDAFPNATDRGTPISFEIVKQSAFQTPLNHSYACLAQEILKSADGNTTVKFSDVRLEAFTTTGFMEFSSSIDCPADDSSDVVPIAVGAALAGLVVIVLLAYLIGRRRSRARGYQSV